MLYIYNLCIYVYFEYLFLKTVSYKENNIFCNLWFDCVKHNKLWKILKEMGILDT